MAYLGNDLQVAFPSYKIIDDISGSFNGVLTSFALQVSGVTPVPFPINPQQCLISVNGVVQEPDPTGSSGFNLVGSNIVFASAPTGGHTFFGVILAGADYINVGVNYPSGSAFAPSITFDTDLDTGIYNPAPNELAITTNSTKRFNINSSGQVEISSAGSNAAPALFFNTDTNTGLYSPGADQVAISTNGAERLAIESDGDVRFGSSANYGLIRGWDSTTGNMIIGADQSSTGTGGSALIFRSRGTERARITSAGTLMHLGAGNSTTPAVQFNGSAPANSMVMLSDGRLGLGTSSPQQLLHLNNSGSSCEMRITSSYADFLIQAGDAGDDGLHFYDMTNSAYRMMISNAGNVGIGTTSPSNFLHIKNDTTGNTYAIVENTTAGNAGINLKNANGDWNIIANAELRFVDNTAGTDRVRIDSSGRLLVGTSSARTAWDNTTFAGNLLQVERSGALNSCGVSITSNPGTSSPTEKGAFLYLARSRGTTNGSNSVVASGDLLGKVSYQGADGSEQVEAAKIEAFVDGTPGANDMPGRLVFSTTADGGSTPTERMRINSAGTPGLLTPEYGLHVTTAVGAGTSVFLFSGRHSSTSMYGGPESIIVYTNGNVVNTNNSYGAISDIKLKENIVDASSQWDDLKDLRVVNYNFKEGQTHTQIGLIAQEVELVSPGLVSESPDRDEEGNDLGTVTKSVNYSVLYMKAVKALQEAMERIETLEASNTDLLARVTALEGN